MKTRNNCANQNTTINMATAFSLLSTVHPQVASIIQQVRNSRKIDSADKRMIEDQLLAMCGTLNSANKYVLIMGRWNNDNPYSDARAKVALEKKTIRSETVFTIVRCATGRKCWAAYVDLPIDVVI